MGWHGYSLKAKEEGSVIASILEENEALLIYAEKELNRARASLPAMLCLSNEDMDSKNIMWDNGAPSSMFIAYNITSNKNTVLQTALWKSLDSLTHGGVRGRELITPSYSFCAESKDFLIKFRFLK